MTDVPSLPDVTWLRPSPRMWSARRLLLLVITSVVLAVVGVSIGLSAGTTAGLVSIACVVAAAVPWWFVLRGRYRAWGYAERADDLLVRRGVLVRRLSVVPYGRMQFVDVTAGPIDRMFRLSTVQLHTAAAATDARIPGLPVDEAQRLRDRLAALGESRAAGL
jgi:membrane protein YdbS with pleckstrin-like domain